MINSTVTEKQERQGPIRTGAVVPAAIVLLVSFLYFHFLFASHLRKAMEWTATYIHGAEVNIDSVNLSFLGASFQLQNLQVTDKETPARNLIQIGDIRFKFSWDALLRLKFVVIEGGIDDIQIYSTRTSPGWVKPPDPPVEGKTSVISEIESNALNQVQDEYSGNVLGDAAALLEGSDQDDLLKNIQSELKAEAKINQLETELKEKQQLWKERFDKLPQKEEFDRIAKDLKAVDLKTKNPAQLAANLKKVSELVKEADKKLDSVKDASRDLKKDVGHYSTELNQIDDLVTQDIKDIESRLKIPDFESGDFSKNLFAKMISAKLGSIQKYMAVAREYMPPPKDDSSQAPPLVPPTRGQGKNYRFPVTTGYPLFWLKHASISSKSTPNGFSGDVAGKLTDVTTDPAIVGRPLILDVKGEFPKSQIYGSHLLITVDHIAEPKESLELSVAQFPLQEFQITESPKLKFGIQSATGKSVMGAKLQNNMISMALNNEFTNLKYSLDAKSSAVKEALDAILAGIPVVTLNAEATGSWDDIDMHINSNLGKELSRGFATFVKAKVDALRAKIKDQVEGRIKGKKEKLTSEYNKVKDQFDGSIKDKTDELDKTRNEMKSQANASKSSSKDKMKNDLKEKGKKLLKGLGL